MPEPDGILGNQYGNDVFMNSVTLLLGLKSALSSELPGTLHLYYAEREGAERLNQTDTILRARSNNTYLNHASAEQLMAVFTTKTGGV